VLWEALRLQVTGSGLEEFFLSNIVIFKVSHGLTLK
jgi:hypothetical protein